MKIEATISHLVCQKCEAKFPTATFNGDTDMATQGLHAATCVGSGSLAVGLLSGFAEAYNEECSKFAAQMRNMHGMNFQPVPVIAHIGEKLPPAATSFQKFREGYLPPVPVYRCPRCGGKAVVRSREDILDFEAQGAALFLSNLTLR